MPLFDFMYSVPDWVIFIISVIEVAIICICALGLMRLLRRIWPERHGANLINTMLSGILLPTGMVIAFVAADVWQTDAKGRNAVEQEAIAISDTLRIARFFDSETREIVLADINNYIRDVVETEWPLMAQGQFSETAESLLEALDILSVRIEGESQEFSQRRAAQELRHYTREIEQARNQRLLVSHQHVSITKWFTLLMLLFVSACVMIELHLAHRRALYVSMGLFSLGFGAALFLISAYDGPFLGRGNIGPESLALMLLK
uniref:bestrophin-like domain n=1 Tax=Castellaniella defragrans TaxID=75697 RepID=UPI003341DE3E